eukprot:12133211-Alexandrium_andersonii.AAC.1
MSCPLLDYQNSELKRLAAEFKARHGVAMDRTQLRSAMDSCKQQWRSMSDSQRNARVDEWLAHRAQ